ncbi:MAG TPA: ATP-binding cassette domain-containing protein [Bacilli bacterium]|nr:ATP-binding cassette domain-containing protein [Bacilli bacterium]
MFSVFSKLAWFFKEHWKRYSIVIFALIIVNILEMIPPRLLGITIDLIQFNELTSRRLTQILVAFFVIIIVKYFVMLIWDINLFVGAVILERKLRSKVMRHLLKMNPRFYSKNRSGDLMARSTNDLKSIMMTAGFGVMTLFDSTVLMVFIILVMGFSISWSLTFTALISMPFIALAMQKYGQAIHQRFTEAQTAFSEMNNYTLESIRGVRVVRAFVQESYDHERFAQITETVFKKNKAVAELDALFDPTIKILVGLSYTIGLGYGTFLVINDQLSIGDLVTFNIYLGMMIWPMIALGHLINVLQRGHASLDRVEKILAQKPDVTDPEQPKSISTPEVIGFNRVSFSYPGTEENQLKQINLTIYRGETIGVVGKTGSGKTTLFKQLLRDYLPPKGELTINGIEIDQFTLEETRSWIGYVPQEQILFSKTIRENLSFGTGPISDQAINQILTSTSLKSDIDALPKGLDTIVGESGVTLSGGQKQRVSLVRALLVDPEILILDDSLSAVDGETEAIKEFYVNVLATFFNAIIYMGGILFALFLLNTRLAMICLLAIPILFLWIKFYQKYAGKYNRVIRSVNSSINASINESIQTMPIIQAFRRTKERQDEFEELNHRHYRYQRQLVRLESFTTYNLLGLLRGAALLLFIWFFGNGVLTGHGLITTGVLYAFADYLGRLFEPMEMLIHQLPQLEQARVSADRVFEMLDLDGEAVDDKEIPRINGHVRFDQVSFAYEANDYILHDLSFNVEPGESVAFVGHTGSGKSSIMNLLLRFYDQQKGRIFLDQYNSQELSRQQVRQHINIVLQDPFIFTGTVLSNIILNDPKITREKAIKALKTVGADQFIEKLPLKYDQPVGENGADFSTGQRQLLSFARALAFDPAILILDEATASIDTETEGLIQTAISILAEGRTMLIIAHRLSTIQHADQIIVMNKGKMIEQGTHDELLAQKGNYYQMFKMQQVGLAEQIG